ncbi:MAG: 1,4-alpha-glucan branching enzyme [Candidatus Atribacteria bacterium]|nr:1,4-alpha-glucan branching enzyme [Candidatus Atribacteria bacterium]
MDNYPLKTVTDWEIESILQGDSHDPFSILGAHRIANREEIAIRVFHPSATRVGVKLNEKGKETVQFLEKIHPGGFFELVTSEPVSFPYLLVVFKEGEQTETYPDPYSFPPFLSDFDLYLFNQGTHHFAYQKLGAHPAEMKGFPGVQFAVWAPNAQRVSVVGDFNQWDGRIHQMRVRGNSGVWEIFLPSVKEGSLYKFEIKTKSGQLLLKSDPFGFWSELRPATASIVYSLAGYQWHDEEWREKREQKNLLSAPVNIYEVHPGSWKRGKNNQFLNYRELAQELVQYLKEMGYTHLELMPVAEHPFDGSWGYQVTGYFAPTSRFGTPKDLMYLVDLCHQNNLGVILDWVIAHFPKDSHGLGRFDGTALFEHLDPRLGEHPHWGSYIFNYGRKEVISFLVSNAIYWLNEYHFDGLRVDAVASMLYLDYGRKEGEWIPNIFGGKENLEAIDFLRYCNQELYQHFPGIATIAEESTAWPGVTQPPYTGGLGFLFKWNMGWMNDFLTYLEKDPVYRKFHHHNLTFPILYAFSENFILPLSHDEVVHQKRNLVEKMPGDDWQKMANLRLAYGAMFGYPGKKLLFMGSEFAQRQEWNHDTQLDWFLLQYPPHQKMQKWVKDLNQFYLQEKALWEFDYSSGGFEWIDCEDAQQSVISFIRRAKDPQDFIVFVCNFTPAPRFNYRIGVPEKGIYQEILNSDSEIYGGSNLGNLGKIKAEKTPAHGRPYSLALTLPPLACLILKPKRQ